MESRRERNESDESFSFPSTPNQDSDFEFGSLTPESPSSDPFGTSPADHLFFNGRLLPHSFSTTQPHTNRNVYYYEHSSLQATCRTGSFGSKKYSSMSSRSNSVNSSSSSHSSGRTSCSSDYSSDQRKLLYQRNKLIRGQGSQAYRYRGNSQRWQYLTVTAVPVLSRESSHRSKVEEVRNTERVKAKGDRKRVVKAKTSFGGKLVRWLVKACRECHAMEYSST